MYELKMLNAHPVKLRTHKANVLRCVSALVGLSCSSCDGWGIFQKDAPIAKAAPYRLTLLSVESCALPDHLDKKNVSLHSYRVRLEGNDRHGVPANYFYASLLTTDGERYLSTYWGCQPLLSADPLFLGEQAEGFVNFSIPPSKVPDRLAYSPKIMKLSDQASTIELPLTEGSEGLQDSTDGSLPDGAAE